MSNDRVDVAFRQHIASTDPLRTGTYDKTLTFTLSTTTRERSRHIGNGPAKNDKSGALDNHDEHSRKRSGATGR